MPAPILQGLTGLVFLLPAQAGMICTNHSRNTEAESMLVHDASVAYDIGFVAFNPGAKYSISGKKSGSSGLAAAAPFVALTVADTKFGNGVGTDATDCGTVWTETFGQSHGEKAFRELSITAMQKPGITAA